MPQIKIRGINENQICEISEKMIDELVDAVKCPRDYFEIECIKSVAIRNGKIAEVYPAVSVRISDTDMIYSFENDSIAVILQREDSISTINPYQATLQIIY